MEKLEDVQAIEIGPEDLLPRLKDNGYDLERVGRRRGWVERKTGADLQHIGSLSWDSELMRGNIENPIGVAQVPMGVAGPVLIQGQNARGLFYVPMATTEGALIRSYERGMVALTKSGGVQTALLADENQTAPAFFFDDTTQAAALPTWIEAHLPEIREAAGTTTRHGKLVNAKCYQTGRQVIVNFGFRTGDAQGMNMIVRATDAACHWIRDNYPGTRYFLFSGLCGEKRASGFLMSRGKGKRVTAGALLTKEVLRIYLHTTADQMFRVWQSTVVGNLQAGAIGYTGHAANGIAAMFIAMGQDVANVVNSSCAVTVFEPHAEGLYVSVTLPALSIATVGGGTALPTAGEALGIVDCVGSGKAAKLAEIVTATILGGEVSMGAAIASGEFVGAHERYGRNRPA
ncbi:MAG TPA: hydroxymethylglutaryl-CoA reductase [Bryobacteraceae bacterium]|nr:hydroxymethylglutaryl-CoA reductase [Bryobacteraceae bacterium]